MKLMKVEFLIEAGEDDMKEVVKKLQMFNTKRIFWHKVDYFEG